MNYKAFHFSIAIILVLLSLCCNGQHIPRKKTLLSTFRFAIVSDSISNSKIVAKFSGDTLKLIDTSAAVILLMQTFKQLKQQEKELKAATDILDIVDSKGFVFNKNRVKFNKAVLRYRKLLGNKRKIDLMLPFDILIKDTKGNNIGWIKQ